MDKSALKEKRRETVIGLLKGMTIQKNAKEGFDKEDVYGCIQELCNLYEKHIEELEVNYEAEIGELTKRYQKYDENNELYMTLIIEAKKTSNEMINQAKEQVQEILASGKERIELQEKQLEEVKADSEMQKAAIATELQTAKEVAEAEKATMKVEIEAEKEKIEAIKNKYRQQISSMEGEFAEIRTNILRTSARLDALKAQAEEETPEIKWDVAEAETISMPASDVEVDDVIDIASVTGGEQVLEDALSSDEAFAETFFKSEILEQAPIISEPVVEEPLLVEPVITVPIVDPMPEEPVVMETFEEKAEEVSAEDPVIEELEEPEEKVEESAEGDDIDALLDEISFDDLLEDNVSDVFETSGEEADVIEEISLDELEGLGILADQETAEIPEMPVTDIPEEISFEGLEALFKDEA